MKFKVHIVATAALLATGCAQEDVTENATVTAAAAITEAQSTEVPVQLQLAMVNTRPVDLRRWTHEGLQCDTTPTNTQVEVCGKEYPSEIHLDWSGCQLQGFKREGRRGPPPARDGSPLSSGGGATRSPVTSTGKVDVVSTTTAQAACSESTRLDVQQEASFNIQHTQEDGELTTISGTVTSSNSHTQASGPLSQSSTFDTTRTRVDASGNTVDSVRLTGTLESSFSQSEDARTHTSNGTLTMIQADGSHSTVTLTDVVRVPRETCDWPISGKIARIIDGGASVLVFGPECGQATLDGEAITLPSHGGPGGPCGRGDQDAGGRGGPGGRMGGGR
ncbi:hypothetical protein [Hyalangium gracile]|uniref:hypothetical protein n=1 Tax=Hyalangium gracile TaxID=394092 RepID=UPI001CCAC505|nr:hypothetical protein [Hyalangium gracile]